MMRLKGWLQQLWKGRTGAALDDVVWMMGWILVGSSALIMALELWSTFHTRQVLQQAGQIVDRSIVASGCLTTNAEDQLTSFLKSNGLAPSRVYLNASSTQQAYGSRNLSATVGYDLTYAIPFTGWQLWNRYTQVSVPSDQSQYVPGDGAGSAGCSSSATIAAAFGGTSNYGGTGGSGSTSTVSPTVTSVTLTASPSPVSAGDPITLSGTAMEGSNPAPTGTQVEITTSLGTKSASVGSNGNFSITYSTNTPGTYTFTASAGVATATAKDTVNPSTAATLDVSVPSSIQVGQAFTIQVSALDQYGNAVANGTNISISSSDAKDIPSVTLQTQGGQVQDQVSGIAQEGTITITVATGSLTKTAAIQVTPGAPQAVTLSAKPTSIVAGQSVTLNGQVYGPDNTPPQNGTPVTIASTFDTQDPMPTTSTNAQGQFSITATLTLAGVQSLVAQVPTGGSTITSQPAQVTVTPGLASQVANFSASPNPVEQGATTTFTGTIEDSYGNPEPADVPVTISGGGLTNTLQTVTNSKGDFSVSGSFQGSGTQTVTATSSGNSLSGGTIGVRVQPTGSYSLTANPSTASITAGQSTTTTWTLLNSQGQPVPNVPITFSISPSVSNAITPASGTTNSQGQISVTVGPLTQAANYTLTATDGSATNVTGTMGISVTAAAPTTVDPPVISPNKVQAIPDGGTTYPTISGILLDQYGNVVANATVSISGGWDPGVPAVGTTNSQGYFLITLNPQAVGGPYYPTITTTSANGTTTQTYTDTSLTVVASTSIIPPGTPMNYGVTLTGSVGNYYSSWYGNADVSLTATASQTVSGTPWFIGIYDETTGTWQSSYNAYPSEPASGGSGTTFSVAVASNFNSNGQTDTYVAAVGIMKPGMSLNKSVIIAVSAPLTLTLPTLKDSYTGWYPDIWSAPYYYTGWGIAFDSATMIQFFDAQENSTSAAIDITSISDGVSNGIEPPYGVQYPSLFYDYYNMDPITVQWHYTIPLAPTTTYTTTIGKPSYEAWSFGAFGEDQYNGVQAYANAYAPSMSQLYMDLNYGGQTYAMSLTGGTASSLNGYDYLVWLGGQYFTNTYNYTDLMPPSGTTVDGTARMTGSNGYTVNFSCSITFGSYGKVTGGSCSQTGYN